MTVILKLATIMQLKQYHFPGVEKSISRAPPSHEHRNMTSLAPQERLPELPIIPREQHHSGAAVREKPQDVYWQAGS